ncbi:hypothetical protein ADL12_08890 [Streptomyces regalis]|uniref:Uncharacterized protein n=1 Tax=Streptomyces regalis TaxID=68262 RepID=A0A0X3VDC2_9ACTN|nr:hypothetical protein ADL12_08890 [Streptomyces regalis]
MVQEPQAPLRERQRHGIGSFTGGQRRPFPVRAVQPGRQAGDGGRLEQRAQVDVGAEGGPDAAGEAGGEQGVAAEGEEVVVDPDSGQPQCLGEQLTQHLLVRAARGAAASRSRGEVRRGQCGPVQFPVRRHRQRPQHHEGGRHHVRGQLCPRVVAEEGDVRTLPGLWYHIGDELVLVRGDGGVGDRGVGGEGGFDLAGFDAVAADLDLVVRAAEVVQLSVGPSAGEVAGAVHPGAGRAVGVGDEPLRGQAWSAQVAAGQIDPGDVQLARDTRRDWPQRRVQHIRTGAGDRLPDGRCRVREGQRFAHRCAYGGLGGSVGVDHPPSRCPPLQQSWRACLSRDDQRRHIGVRLGHRGQCGGRHGRVGDTQVGVGEGGEGVGGGGEDDCGSGEQGGEQFGYRGVEAG